MKLIHCSDLHLDSSMEANLTADRAAERNGEILHTFARLIGYAREQGVRAVIIAGDLFDTGRATGRTTDFVLHTVAAAPEVDVLYLRGNHDECKGLFAGKRLPDNFKTFGPSWTSYRYGAVTVTGREPEDWAGFYGDLSLDPGDCNIVTLHGQIASSPGEEAVALPLLRGKSIDYLALGHLHSFSQGTLDSRGRYCYSGCLEGRGFDECGEKGFVLLETEGSRVHSTFVPFAARRLWELPVDITGLTTATQILGALGESAGQIPKKDLVKFVLTGRCGLDAQKDPGFLLRQLAGRFYHVRIKDETGILIDPRSYEQDISLKGAFIRRVMASDRTEEEKARIIACGLQALSGEEIAL